MGTDLGIAVRGRGASAWLLAALTGMLALTVAALAGEAVVTVGLSSSPSIQPGDAGLVTLIVVPPLTYEIVGAIILLRRSRNVVAWVMCVLGLSYSLGVFTSDITTYEYRIEHARGAAFLLPGVVSNVIFGPFLLSMAALLMLFPTGRPPGRWWGRIFWADLTVGSVLLLVALFSPSKLSDTPVTNPIGLGFVPSFMEGIAFGTVALLLPVGLAGLVRRFRLSRGDERQQLKWFTYGGALLVVTVFIAFNVNFSTLAVLPYFLALTFMPIATGIAISKYRLWDIDVLINRTLVYGSLTILLGGIYVLGVLATQTVLRFLTGQGSAIAGAITTLTVAALFGPLRRRMQKEIDRRFYRHRYDAAQTLDALSTRLRDKIDLDELSGEILTLVRDTMQPAHASLWLAHGDTQTPKSANIP